MEIKLHFEPIATDTLKKCKYDIYAILKYSMFPELAGEFPNHAEDFPKESKFKIEEI